MKTSLFNEYRLHFLREMQQLYDSGEAAAIMRLVFEEVLGHSLTMLRLKDEPLTEQQVKQLDAILNRLKKLEPVQYILGYAAFKGMRLSVNSSVLIPRPETEELVDWILTHLPAFNKADMRILDVGTGSGCIALSLAQGIPVATVYASDLQTDALNVAELNAKQQQLSIHLFQHDILSQVPVPLKAPVHIWVSNPPYITREEALEMQPHVLHHEPHSALFVTNNDALQFYKALIRHAETGLLSGGLWTAEINKHYAREVMELLAQAHYDAIEQHTDMNGNLRYVTAIKR